MVLRIKACWLQKMFKRRSLTLGTIHFIFAKKNEWLQTSVTFSIFRVECSDFAQMVISINILKPNDRILVRVETQTRKSENSTVVMTRND